MPTRPTSECGGVVIWARRAFESVGTGQLERFSVSASLQVARNGLEECDCEYCVRLQC
jgi:hypothetical protein